MKTTITEKFENIKNILLSDQNNTCSMGDILYLEEQGLLLDFREFGTSLIVDFNFYQGVIKITDVKTEHIEQFICDFSQQNIQPINEEDTEIINGINLIFNGIYEKIKKGA